MAAHKGIRLSAGCAQDHSHLCCRSRDCLHHLNLKLNNALADKIADGFFGSVLIVCCWKHHVSFWTYSETLLGVLWGLYTSNPVQSPSLSVGVVMTTIDLKKKIFRAARHKRWPENFDQWCLEYRLQSAAASQDACQARRRAAADWSRYSKHRLASAPGYLHAVVTEKIFFLKALPCVICRGSDWLMKLRN